MFSIRTMLILISSFKRTAQNWFRNKSFIYITLFLFFVVLFSLKKKSFIEFIITWHIVLVFVLIILSILIIFILKRSIRKNLTTAFVLSKQYWSFKWGFFFAHILAYNLLLHFSTDVFEIISYDIISYILGYAPID